MRDLFTYLWKSKLWWLLPPVIILILFGILIAVSTISPVGPLIYTLF